MEPKEYNFSEIYSKLSDCPFHHKPLEFTCTSPTCTKPRLSCAKCLFDPHSSCMKKMVLLDDILTPNCFILPKTSLSNWIPSEKYRNLLSKIQETSLAKNADICQQKATSLLEEKWHQIENEIKEKMNGILNGVHVRMMEMFKESDNNIRQFKAFDEHFNPEKLILRIFCRIIFTVCVPNNLIY